MRECAGYEFINDAKEGQWRVAICESVPGTRAKRGRIADTRYVAICESVPGTSIMTITRAVQNTVAICESVPGTRSP